MPPSVDLIEDRKSDAQSSGPVFPASIVDYLKQTLSVPSNIVVMITTMKGHAYDCYDYDAESETIRVNEKWIYLHTLQMEEGDVIDSAWITHRK